MRDPPTHAAWHLGWNGLYVSAVSRNEYVHPVAHRGIVTKVRDRAEQLSKV